MLNSVTDKFSVENEHQLTLPYGDLSLECVTHLAQKLHETPYIHIQKLELCANNLTPDKVQLLVPALRRLKSLQILDLSFNAIGDSGFREVYPLAKQGHLRQLCLCSNNISEQSMLDFAKHMDASSSLETISLSDNNFSSNSVNALLEKLSSLILKTINLNDAALDDSSLYVLKNVLPRARIENLYIGGSRNRFGEAILNEFFSLSNNYINLRYLYFAGASLARVDSTAFGPLLSQSNLQELDVSCCDISSSVLTSILSALSSGTSLTQIHLQENHWLEDHIHPIFQVIANSSLHALSIGDIKVSDICKLRKLYDETRHQFLRNQSLVNFALKINGEDLANLFPEVAYLLERNGLLASAGSDIERADIIDHYHVLLYP